MIYPTKERAEFWAQELSGFGAVYVAGRNKHGWTIYRIPCPGYWHSDRLE